MDIRDIRMWAKDTSKNPVCEECGKQVAAPIMSDRTGDRGNNWTHDHLPNGGRSLVLSMPKCAPLELLRSGWGEVDK